MILTEVFFSEISSEERNGSRWWTISFKKKQSTIMIQKETKYKIVELFGVDQNRGKVKKCKGRKVRK